MNYYIATGICAVVASIAWQVIQNVYLSPLSRIPGPFLAKVTPKWLMLVDMRGNRTSTIHKLHQKYGDTVRVGPKEISLANGDMIKEVYGQTSVFLKAPIYDSFSQRPVGIFAMRNKEDHRQRRKLLSHAFAQSNLLEIEPVIGNVMRQLLGRIEENLNRPIDALLLLRMFALDIVGELFVGKSFDALISTKPPEYIQDLDRVFKVSGMRRVFPRIFKIASYWPSHQWQEFLRAPQRMRAYGKSALKDYRNRNDGQDPNKRKYKDLLTKIIAPPSVLSSDASSTEQPMTEEQIGSEIGNLVFAGTDTTSTTLTYLFWQLAQCKWQDRLREELHNVLLVDKIAKFEDVNDCPILDAVISESLRLFPAAPASLQRETPAGGKALNGCFIPGGTVVSMQCYTTQRNPSVFPRPNNFDPTRWLQAPEKMKDMNLYQMPFSKGSRACLGKNLAMMELKLVVATVVKQYYITVAPDMKDGDMDMKDHFLAMPKCGRCNLVFNKA